MLSVLPPPLRFLPPLPFFFLGLSVTFVVFASDFAAGSSNVVDAACSFVLTFFLLFTDTLTLMPFESSADCPLPETFSFTFAFFAATPESAALATSAPVSAIAMNTPNVTASSREAVFKVLSPPVGSAVVGRTTSIA